jgi:hypothetical protein
MMQYPFSIRHEVLPDVNCQLKKQKQIDDDHIHKMSFFSLPQLNKKSEQNTIPTKVGVSLTLPQWKVLWTFSVLSIRKDSGSLFSSYDAISILH